MQKTSLAIAAEAGDVKKIKRLLNGGHRPEEPYGEYNSTVIHACVKAKQIESLITILEHNKEKKKCLSNLSDINDATPLFLACADLEQPSLEVIRVLLEAGANPNVSSWDEYDEPKVTPLYCICSNNDFRRLDAAKLLIEFGADVNLDRNETTPLHAVCGEYCNPIDDNLAKYILDLGDVDVLNSVSSSPLCFACNSNNLEIVKYILGKSKKMVNQINNESCIPLAAAASVGNLEMVKVLIEAGADVHIRCGASVDNVYVRGKTFLPIHSSLVNMETFKFFLNVTEPCELLPNNRYLDDPFMFPFPIFVMFYSSNAEIFEVLLEHEFPMAYGRLNVARVHDVVTSILNLKPEYEISLDLLLERFQLFFKYYINFEPDSVFSCLSRHLTSSSFQLERYHRFINVLSKMGISSNGKLLSEKYKIYFLLNKIFYVSFKKENLIIMTETCCHLQEPILSLKQLSRIAVRRAISNLTDHDWSAFQMIRDARLPPEIKEYLWYQKLD